MRTNFNEQERQRILEMDVESLATVVFRYLKKNLSSDPDYLRPCYVRYLWRQLFEGGS